MQMGWNVLLLTFLNQKYQKNISSSQENLKVGYPSISSRFGVSINDVFIGNATVTVKFNYYSQRSRINSGQGMS